jgi:hypothetical protein
MNLTIIVLSVLASLLLGFLGRNKKLGFWGFFFASLLFTPVLGLLLLIIAGPAKSLAQPQR